MTSASAFSIHHQHPAGGLFRNILIHNILIYLTISFLLKILILLSCVLSQLRGLLNLTHSGFTFEQGEEQ